MAARPTCAAPKAGTSKPSLSPFETSTRLLLDRRGAGGGGVRLPARPGLGQRLGAGLGRRGEWRGAVRQVLHYHLGTLRLASAALAADQDGLPLLVDHHGVERLPSVRDCASATTRTGSALAADQDGLPALVSFHDMLLCLPHLTHEYRQCPHEQLLGRQTRPPFLSKPPVSRCFPRHAKCSMLAFIL